MSSIIPDGHLVYGMQLPVQSLSKYFAEAWERTADVDAMISVAQRADELGFFYLGVCDHVGIPSGPMAEVISTTWYDTVATLGLVAGVTHRVRLLSEVYILGYRHPLNTAKAFATLDRLSKGRAILGVAVGYLREEFEALGATFDGRGPIADEAIACLRACFADEFPRFQGTHFRTGELGISPRPVQAALPIWVGGSSRPALRRVAAYGDGWLPQGTPKEKMAPLVAYLNEERSRLDRHDPLDIGFLGGSVYVGTPSWDQSDRPPAMTGSAERIAEYVADLRSLGVNHVQVGFRSRSVEEHLDQMEAWAKDVWPLVPS